MSCYQITYHCHFLLIVILVLILILYRYFSSNPTLVNNCTNFHKDQSPIPPSPITPPGDLSSYRTFSLSTAKSQLYTRLSSFPFPLYISKAGLMFGYGSAVSETFSGLGQRASSYFKDYFHIHIPILSYLIFYSFVPIPPSFSILFSPIKRTILPPKHEHNKQGVPKST
jgi:hypothetical protein